jgi:hypothetical protein
MRNGISPLAPPYGLKKSGWSPLMYARGFAVLSLVFFIAGLVILGNAVLREANWKTATGSVTSAKWQTMTSRIGVGLSVRQEVTICYSFSSLDGGKHSGVKTVQDAYGLKIENGQPIEVFYNPDKPTDNMLKLSVRELYKYGLLLIGLELFCGLLACRQRCTFAPAK